MNERPIGVCDQCAHEEQRLVQTGDTYVCEECFAYHLRAVDAAARAMRALAPAGWWELAAVAVKAYCEFTDDPAHDLHEIVDERGKRTECRACFETHPFPDEFDGECPQPQLGLGEVS